MQAMKEELMKVGKAKAGTMDRVKIQLDELMRVRLVLRSARSCLLVYSHVSFSCQNATEVQAKVAEIISPKPVTSGTGATPAP